MHRLLLATRNSHKTREFAQMLGAEFDVCDLACAPEFSPVKETGATFAENASLKAVAASKHFSGPVIADDSGLEVDALNGAPGIYSARYAG
ncbi:MAG: non-canonical purine NTP pyrophosphatase, partial [Verrucomicrobiota bacterium]|nr:non-canonical purine NTP pyrophosphatase [Verrucomicrobiota bacterium]